MKILPTLALMMKCVGRSDSTEARQPFSQKANSERDYMLTTIPTPDYVFMKRNLETQIEWVHRQFPRDSHGNRLVTEE